MPRGPKLRISEFPDDGHSWRIDWFGEVIFRDRMRLRNHPSINVYLSRLIANQGIFGNRTTTSDEQQRQCTVSVGKLMLLRIGDVWRDQQLHESPTYEVETFRDLLIDREITALVKAGLSHDDGSFLLPLSEHPGHRRNTHSYCLRVSLPDERQLVIPCAELIRFYFGSSSELMNLLFRPGLTKDRLFKSLVFNPSTRYMKLELSDHVHPRSAADIGRIAGSSAAWRAANLGLTSCLKGISAGGAPYPQGVFPFEGETDLTVSGKWLRRAERERQTFLVYQIHSCSHPFPFNVLNHSGGSSRSKKKGPQGEHDAQSADGKFGSKSKAPKEPSLVEADPATDLKPTVRAINAKRKFSDLERKVVYGSKTLSAIQPSGPTKQHPAIEEEAAGEPGSIHRCRPIALVDALDVVGLPPAWLVEVNRTLRSTPGIEVELLTCSDEDGWTVPLPLFANEDGVINELLFTEESGTTKPRSATAFKVAKQGRLSVLVLIESAPLVSMLYRPVQGEKIDLTAILNWAAINYCERSTFQSPSWSITDAQLHHMIQQQLNGQW